MATPTSSLISSTPDVLGGTPVFRGTRVPVQTLIEYLEGGQTIDDFLDGFPTVTREQIIAFLEEAKARMLTVAS
ncbi:MAG: DUF433 domain-containing protein [Nitrospiraceae bacterium]|nr:DUF433 domain-containing protein [Nitrospiraceae bacterium]MSR23737.1 DUF433 domain-containing protein [Nitrospiraceae bacterium]